MKVVFNQEYTTEGKENLVFMTDTSIGKLRLWVEDEKQRTPAWS
jgi:hypothetical protein